MKKTTKEKQAIDGIFLLNKPQGLSSNAALQKVKRLFSAKKAGHTGSLDPLATGMLPICFGEATKFSQYLLDADKTYLATGLLGIKTDTADALGEIIAEQKDFTVSRNTLQDVIDTFLGRQLQTPSMYSALKHQGRPLYKLARKGIEVERKAREIVIDELELLDFNGQQFSIRVSCSKGTYIRNLIQDIGERLSCHAHVTQLHRSFTAGFDKETMVSLEDLEAMEIEERLGCLLPMDKPISHFSIVQLSHEEVGSIQQGRQVLYKPNSNQSNPLEIVRIVDIHNRLIGLADLDEKGYLKPRRLLAIL